MARQKQIDTKKNALPSGGQLLRIALKELHFDLTNPRYGPDTPQIKTDQAALEYIANRFDMTDVLASISVNGFFDSEPLVGIETQENGYKVVEGNRRLAACLILAGDQRATNLKRHRQIYPVEKDVLLDKLPVIAYPASQVSQLLPYLGVRHIVGGKPWDSYAKAHWVAQLLADKKQSIKFDDIKKMLGDTTGLIDRLVSAYFVVRQLQDKDLFNPKYSIKKGRGSADFPFSLIYNVLDVQSVREWLKLKERIEPGATAPIPVSRLADAADMVKMICGNSKDNFPPVFDDSRDIRTFAKVIQDPLLFSRLKKGVPLASVRRDTIQPYQRVLEDLATAQPALEDANTVLASNKLHKDEAKSLVETGTRMKNLADVILRTLREQSDLK